MTDVQRRALDAASTTAGSGDGEPEPDATPGRSRWARLGLTTRRRRALTSLAVGVLIWEFVARVVVEGTLFFVPITDVARAGVDLTISGELPYHAWVSFQEFAYGLGLAVVVGIPLGVAVGVSPRVKDYVQPWISGLYSTPLIALAPLFILWLGIGLASKIAVVFIMALFPITINTTAGIKNTDQALIDVGRAFGYSRQQIFAKVLLPSALSFIVTGFRLAVGRGIVAVVVAEFFGSRAGLGYLILVSSQSFAMDQLLLAVLVLAFTGILGLGLVERLERRLAPWKEEMTV